MTSLYPQKANPSNQNNSSSKSRNKLRSMSLQNSPLPPPTSSSQLASYPDLPSDPKKWSSSHVASYLTYCLRLYPPTIVSDLSKYVQNDVTLTGRKFLRLKEDQLRQMNFNERWIKLIMVAVKSLRRDHLKDKILLNSKSDVGGMKTTQDSSEDSDGEQPSSLIRSSLGRSSSYSSTTSASSFTNNDLKDFLIPNSFSNLSSDDKEFISQEFDKLKELLKSDVEKENNNNTTIINELNRIIEKANDNNNDKLDEITSKLTSSFFWENIKSGFLQGVMIGGIAVWAYMRYVKW